MIALSWRPIRASSCPIRALTIAWVSFDTFIEPVTIWSTNSPIRPRASSCCSSSRASRESAMILSRRLTSWTCGAASATSGSAWTCSNVLISIILPGRGALAGLALELLERVGVADDVLRELNKPLVAVDLAHEVLESLPRVEEPAQRLDLLDDLVGGEVVDVVEPQLDEQLRPVVLQRVVDLVGEPGLGGRQDLVEIVAIDLDELAVLEPGQRLLGLAGEVGEDAHHERQLLQLDRPADLHVVRDVHPRAPDAIQFVLHTL